jgi:hypothetical protein
MGTIVMTDLGYDHDTRCFRTEFDYGAGIISISKFFGPGGEEYRQIHDYNHLLAMGVAQDEIEALGLRKLHLLIAQ